MSVAKEKLNHALGKGAETTTYLKAYVDSQLKLQKLALSSKISKGITGIVQSIITIVLFLGIALFSFIALAIYLGELFGSMIYGFLAIAGIFLLIYILFLIVKKPLIQKPTTKKISKAIFKDDSYETYDVEVLKQRVSSLEKLIEQSVNDLPQAISTIKPKDFLPKSIFGRKRGKSGESIFRIPKMLISKVAEGIQNKFFKEH